MNKIKRSEADSKIAVLSDKCNEINNNKKNKL